MLNLCKTCLEEVECRGRNYSRTGQLSSDFSLFSEKKALFQSHEEILSAAVIIKI